MQTLSMWGQRGVSDGYLEAVVGYLDVGREFGRDLVVESHFVADVGEVGFAGVQLADDFE